MDGDGWKRMAWVVAEVERVRLGRNDMEMIGVRDSVVSRGEI